MGGVEAAGMGRAYLCVKTGRQLFLIPVDQVEAVASVDRLREGVGKASDDASKREPDYIGHLGGLLGLTTAGETGFALIVRVPCGLYGVEVDEVLDPVFLREAEIMEAPVQVLSPRNAYLTGLWIQAGGPEIGFLLDMERLLAAAAGHEGEGKDGADQDCAGVDGL